MNLEVEVTAGRVAEVPDLADLLPGDYGLTVRDPQRPQVRLPRRELADARTDLHEPVSCPGLIRANDDRA